jgi:hypothetical protein
LTRVIQEWSLFLAQHIHRPEERTFILIIHRGLTNAFDRFSGNDPFPLLPKNFKTCINWADFQVQKIRQKKFNVKGNIRGVSTRRAPDV